MPRLAVAATKGNLLRLREERGLAAEALSFLEEKRDLLMGELLRLQAQAARMRRAAEGDLSEAYEHLRLGLLQMGREAVARAALGVKGGEVVRLTDRAFLGLPMPVVEFVPGSAAPQVSFASLVPALEACQAAVRQALARLAELGEVEAVLWRLVTELKGTIRRTNALNYVLLPAYRETIHYMESTLEEREREALFQLKRVKAKAARKG